MQSVRYLIFDVESFVDAPLAASLHFPEDESLAEAPLKAVHKWNAELKKKKSAEGIPYTFQIPSAVVLAKISENFELLDLAALSEVRMNPEEIVERFWLGWERYDRPTFVTFNGRGSALPLLVLSAFRYGLALPGWFSPVGKNFEWPRNRFNQSAHIDLLDVFTAFGTTGFPGGLPLAATLLGKSGKTQNSGETTQELHEAGKFQEIENRCVGGVLDAYFVFLRTRVMTGHLSPGGEKKLVEAARRWLEEKAGTNDVFREYLAAWEP